MTPTGPEWKAGNKIHSSHLQGRLLSNGVILIIKAKAGSFPDS